MKSEKKAVVVQVLRAGECQCGTGDRETEDLVFVSKGDDQTRTRASIPTKVVLKLGDPTFSSACSGADE